MPRTQGFYWVRLTYQTGWTVGEWHPSIGRWMLVGYGRLMTDEFIEVGAPLPSPE